jgi:hypothetical protein
MKGEKEEIFSRSLFTKRRGDIGAQVRREFLETYGRPSEYFQMLMEGVQVKDWKKQTGKE